jgi:hypothetical protein
MGKVHYEIRPVDVNRTLLNFEDRDQAINWAKSRNSNPVQTPVRVVEVITQRREFEVSL